MRYKPKEIWRKAWTATTGPVRSAASYSNFLREFRRFKGVSQSSADGRFPEIQWSDRRPCFNDDSADHDFNAHYVYHTAWATRVLAQIRPAKHVDISSLLYFSTILSAFIPVEFYDYRLLPLHLDNMTARKGDLLALPFADNSVVSLSCMHVVEHIGLGRYGDPMDADGDLKAIEELKRVIAPGGSLLFVAPVGKARIQFNAHRIYAHRQVLNHFQQFDLREFSLIPDDGDRVGMIANATEQQADSQGFGCGCYWFEKPIR